MIISFAMILDRLDKYQISIPATFENLSAKVKSVQFLDASTLEYHNDILYLNYSPETPQDRNGIFHANIIYIQNRAVLSNANVSDIDYRIILFSDSPPYKILEDIYNVFLFYHSYFDQMFMAMANNKALQSMIELTAKCLGNPVFIMDNDVNFLAYSKTYSMEHNTMVAHSISQGFIDVTGHNSHVLRENINQSRNNNNAFIFSDPELEYRNITKNIIVNGKNVGFIQIPETQKPLTKGMLDTVEIISSMFAIEMQRDYLLHSNLGMLTSQFILDLLENKITTPESLSHRINGLNWKITKNIYVLCVSPKSDFLTNAQLARIRDQLTGIIKFSKGIIYDHNVVFIISRNNNALIEDSSLSTLSELLQKMKLNAGLSLSANSLILTHKLYKQSLRAIKLGVKQSPNKQIYRFSEYLIDAFFDSCFQIDELNDYIHQSLMKLQEYDKKHQTSFMETLKHFIFNRNNQIKTSKCLHIHRSTLLYRIQKIEEIMDVHLEDSDTFFHILLSLKLIEYSECSPS